MLQPVVYQKSKLAELGRQLYYQLKPKLEKKYKASDVVLIEPDSGEYFVAGTSIDAYKIARKKFPNKKFFVAHVGRLAAMMK